jgi:chromosome segregation ATPase
MTSIAASTRASGRTGVQSTTGKLNALADNFNNFYGDLEEETTVRKQAEEARVARIERECGKLERVIGTETKRRIEASKALQAMFENQLVQLQKEFKEDLREAYEPLQEQIDALIGRVERLEKTMEARAAPLSGRSRRLGASHAASHARRPHLTPFRLPCRVAGGEA